MQDVLLKSIANAVARYYNTDISEMFKESRQRDLADMRSIFHYLAVKYTPYSLATIGSYAMNYGRETPHNHATVLHGKKKVLKLIDVDRNFGKAVREIEAYVTHFLLQANATKADIYNKFHNIVSEVLDTDDSDYLNLMLRFVNILQENTTPQQLNKIIETYEGIHQVTQTDN